MGTRQDNRLRDIKAKAAKQKNKPDPDEIITFRGWKMSRYTATALRVLEELLGFELTILQGPYNPGSVGASAGTHDEDGVVDLAPFRAKKKCTVARRNSWAIWIRPTNWDGRGGVKHLHGCLLRAHPMAPLAMTQRDVAYPAHRDGLASNSIDTFPVHPLLKRFDYAEWWHDELLDDRIKGLTNFINRTIDKLSAARAKRKRLQAERRRKK